MATAAGIRRMLGTPRAPSAEPNLMRALKLFRCRRRSGRPRASDQRAGTIPDPTRAAGAAATTTPADSPSTQASTSNAEDPRMDADLLCQLLQTGVANADLLRLPLEVADHPHVAAVVRFLVAQGWLETGHDTGTWRVTPIGHLWIEDILFKSVKFHRRSGKHFLVHWANHETVVWHAGRFATIAVPFGFEERYDVRLDAELVPTAAGTDMADALSTACRLLTDEPPVQPPAPSERLEMRMNRFLDSL